MAGLDAVHEFGRFALCRNEIEPAARDEQFRQREDLVGDRVAMMVVVEKPGVKAAVAQGILNGRKVHGSSILAAAKAAHREAGTEGGKAEAKQRGIAIGRRVPCGCIARSATSIARGEPRWWLRGSRSVRRH